MAKVLKFLGILDVQLFQPPYSNNVNSAFAPQSLNPVGNIASGTVIPVGAFTGVSPTNPIQIFSATNCYEFSTPVNYGNGNLAISTNVIGSYLILGGTGLRDVTHVSDSPFTMFCQANYLPPNNYSVLYNRRDNSLGNSLGGPSALTVGYNIGIQPRLGSVLRRTSGTPTQALLYDPIFTLHASTGIGTIFNYANFAPSTQNYFAAACVPIDGGDGVTPQRIRFDYVNGVVYSTPTGNSLNYAMIGVYSPSPILAQLQTKVIYENSPGVTFDNATLNATIAPGAFTIDSCYMGFIYIAAALPNFYLIDPTFTYYWAINMTTKVPNRILPARATGNIKIDNQGILYAITAQVGGGPNRVLTSFNMKLGWNSLNIPQIPPMFLDCYSECLGKNAPQAKIY
jgi:hypothetical protein